MSHYRKIHVNIWNDEKFTSLSWQGQHVFMMLITHPSMTCLGAMRHTIAGLASEAKAPIEGFTEAFGEVLREGLVEYDEKSSCIRVVNFVKYQTAGSPNVIKSWVKQLPFIPEGSLKAASVKALEDYVKGLNEGFRKAFREAMPEGYREPVNSKQLLNPPSHVEKFSTLEGRGADFSVDADGVVIETTGEDNDGF